MELVFGRVTASNFFKIDAMIDVFVFWKFATNKQLSRLPTFYGNPVEQRFNTNSKVMLWRNPKSH